MPPANSTVTASVHDPDAGASIAIGPAPPPAGTAPTGLVAPARARRAVQRATGGPPAKVTASGSRAPTAIGAPGSHGLSDPTSPHVYEPSWPTTGSPPSADSDAAGGVAAGGTDGARMRLGLGGTLGSARRAGRLGADRPGRGRGPALERLGRGRARADDGARGHDGQRRGHETGERAGTEPAVSERARHGPIPFNGPGSSAARGERARGAGAAADDDPEHRRGVAPEALAGRGREDGAELRSGDQPGRGDVRAGGRTGRHGPGADPGRRPRDPPLQRDGPAGERVVREPVVAVDVGDLEGGGHRDGRAVAHPRRRGGSPSTVVARLAQVEYFAVQLGTS